MNLGASLRIAPVLFLLSACARTETLPVRPLPASVFDLVPAGKSLRALPQFFLLDDFNAQEPRNRLGGLWKTEAAKAGSLKLEFVAQDALHQHRGSSLRLKVSGPPHTTSVLKSSLGILDMSQAEAIALKCKAGEGMESAFQGKLQLELKDSRGKSGVYDFRVACLASKTSPNGWREVVIPRPSFSGIDWNELKEISILVDAGEEDLKTVVAVDEIAFYGMDNVAFQSQRDNLLGFPSQKSVPSRVSELKAEPSSERFLREIARDTWRYFENAIDQKSRLPVDHIRVGAFEDIGSYTTPTNLAMHFLACVAAHELGFISRKEAVKRIQSTLETLGRMKRWQGFYYNFYHSGNLEVTPPSYVSTVDSGWLAAALIVVRQAFGKELGESATRLLKEINFYEFYDPSVRQLRLGFDDETGNFSPYHYGVLSTEARIASLIGIGKGDLPRKHWWSIYRTPPREWEWQNQIPEGETVVIEGTPVFKGHYIYQGKKFVPSWGGSLFEFLMPTLVVKERELAPEGLGLNNRIATEIHIDYALNRQGYPVWGVSPASTTNGRLWKYGEYGVKLLGVKGYRDEGIVAPYVSFLALDTLPDQAIDNLRRMLESYGEIYGEYGFYDSVNVRNGRVNPQYLVLDQGMSLVALANHLTKGAVQSYFHRDEIVKKVEDLLANESFFR